MLCKCWLVPLAVSLFCVLSGCATPMNGPDPYLVREYTAWGDSLTAGCEDGTVPYCAYPYQLGQLGLNRIVNNLGIGGQTSTQIAVRMGAVPTKVTNAFTIPANGAVSGVTFETGHEPCQRVLYLDGQVEGTIDGVQVYCKDAGNGTYILTRVAAGSVQSVNAGDPWTPVLPDGMLSGMNIIWAGRNNADDCTNFPVSTENCPVASDIAAMTAYVTAHGGSYVVLTDINSEWEPKGSYFYNVDIQLNKWITSTYPDNSVDVRSILVAAYNPANGADVIDYQKDIQPFSLRAFDGSGKLSAAVASSGTCALGFGTTIGTGAVMIVGSEYIFISGGTDGAYTCTRGYGGTTAATYASGTPWLVADPLHLSGDGSKNTNNPNGTGYTIVAKAVQQWLVQHKQ